MAQKWYPKMTEKWLKNDWTLEFAAKRLSNEWNCQAGFEGASRKSRDWTDKHGIRNYQEFNTRESNEKIRPGNWISDGRVASSSQWFNHPPVAYHLTPWTSITSRRGEATHLLLLLHHLHLPKLHTSTSCRSQPDWFPAWSVNTSQDSSSIAGLPLATLKVGGATPQGGRSPSPTTPIN